MSCLAMSDSFHSASEACCKHLDSQEEYGPLPSLYSFGSYSRGSQILARRAGNQNRLQWAYSPQESPPRKKTIDNQQLSSLSSWLISAASVVRLHSPPPNFPLKSSWCLSNFASSRTIPNLASCDISGPFAAIESPPESPPRFSTACLIRST